MVYLVFSVLGVFIVDTLVFPEFRSEFYFQDNGQDEGNVLRRRRRLRRPADYWEILSATPSGNELSPILKAVPNFSSSQDEAFSLAVVAYLG
jgi:hypothetical protein